jgi:hypothetical protein
MNGNALAIHFYGSEGYGSYYGYGCMTKAQFDYTQAILNRIKR